MGLLRNLFTGWFGGAGAIGERAGLQYAVPSASLVDQTANIGPDAALQLDTVWACIERRATTIASLPLFTYDVIGGEKVLARTSRLYALLHSSPNSRMTAYEFWRAMMVQHDLRGNAYARIERDVRNGEAIALWPMPSDQVESFVLDDGSMVYQYTIDSNVMILAAQNVLHLKNLGNGTTGLAKLEFMRATTSEAAAAQNSAQRVFGNGGKPTGVLMVDSVLRPDQRKALQERFAEMAMGNAARLYVLEANMKYQQLSMSPVDQQLLETRKFSVRQICRWMDVPPVLVHDYDGVTYNGAEATIGSWYKTSVRPMLVSIEQAVHKTVMTSSQRARMVCEYSFEALLRGDSAARATFYSAALQNGYMTRNEVRQLENWPKVSGPGADMLTAQANLLPLDKLGTTAVASQTGGNANAAPQNPVTQ